MMKKFLIVIMFVCGFSSMAFADSGSAFVTIFDDVVHVAGYALSLLLMSLVSLMAYKIQQKYHVSIPGTWLDSVHKVIDQSIAYAEERAHVFAESNPLTSNEKLNTALNFTLNILGDDKRLVSLGKDKIKQLIEARLNQVRNDQLNVALQAEDAPTMKTFVTLGDK